MKSNSNLNSGVDPSDLIESRDIRGIILIIEIQRNVHSEGEIAIYVVYKVEIRGRRVSSR